MNTETDKFELTQTDRFVFEKECKSFTGLSRSTRDRLEKRGEFPRRYKVGNQKVAWKRSELLLWFHTSRIAMLNDETEQTAPANSTESLTNIISKMGEKFNLNN
ncbi:AlpA family phage regulatory protein [Escherichia coli]|nr:AlpA family phage regulatory protein [Escherichia coli]